MAAFFTAATTELASSTWALAAGESCTLALTDAAGPALPDDAIVDIQIASTGGEYFNIGVLTKNRPALVLTAVGTFRLFRHVCSAAVGVEKN